MSEDDKTDKIAQDHLSDPSRRSLLKGAGLMGAAAVSAAATGNVIAADSPLKENILKTSVQPEALEVLTAEEAETLEAICDCLIPSDEDGPGAKEARAVHYIDKSLASHNLSVRQNYMISLNGINDFSREVGGDTRTRYLRRLKPMRFPDSHRVPLIFLVWCEVIRSMGRFVIPTMAEIETSLAGIYFVILEYDWVPLRQMC